MTHSRRALAGVLVALTLSACGSSDTAEEATPAASSPGSQSPTDGGPTADPDEPYVPGSPQNEVRPASAQERAEWPACDEVWRADGRIPARYRGCLDGDDAVVADRIACSFGGSMTTFDDRYYGVLGNVVNDADRSLARSRAYLEDFQLCTG